MKPKYLYSILGGFLIGGAIGLVAPTLTIAIISAIMINLGIVCLIYCYK